MQELLKRIRKALGPTRETRQVMFDASGFSVGNDGRSLVKVAWVDVREIFAFKEDRFRVDDICLGFRVDEAGTYWTVSEDFVGYREFLAELESRFTGVRTDWFTEVAFPAFVRNQATIWKTE